MRTDHPHANGDHKRLGHTVCLGGEQGLEVVAEGDDVNNDEHLTGSKGTYEDGSYLTLTLYPPLPPGFSSPPHVK